MFVITQEVFVFIFFYKCNYKRKNKKLRELHASLLHLRDTTIVGISIVIYLFKF